MRIKSVSVLLAFMLVFTYMPAFAGDVLTSDEIMAEENDQTEVEFIGSTDSSDDLYADDTYTYVTDGQTLAMKQFTSTDKYDYICEMSMPNSGYHERKVNLYFRVPKGGAIIFNVSKGEGVEKTYADITGVDIKLSNIKSYADEQVGVRQYIYSAESAGTIKAEITQIMYQSKYGYSAIGAYYVPNEAKTIKAGSTWKGYTHGTTGIAQNLTSFKVKSPGRGYLVMELSDASGVDSSIYMKTTGFSAWETYNDTYTVKYVGVKKGTYTFSVKTGSPFYNIQVRYVKVKEAKYGTSKKAAKSIKKNSAVKGLIVTNDKVSRKTHWCKFKNPKNQNVNISIDSLLGGGGIYGGLKVTVYGKSGKVKSFSVLNDMPSVTYALSSENLYGKLKKGTYYVKIECKKAGTGLFSVKWS